MKKKLLFTGISIITILIVIGALMVHNEIQYRKRMDAALEQITNEKVEPKDINYSSLGRYGAFVKAFAESCTKLNTDMNSMKSEFDKYENNISIDNKYIENPVEGKQSLKQFSDMCLKFKDLLNQDLAQLMASLEKVPLSSKEKEEMKKRENDENAKFLNEDKQLFTSIEAFNSKVDSLYDFLISKKGKYTVEGNKVIFNSQQDVDKYNELIKVINTAEHDNK